MLDGGVIQRVPTVVASGRPPYHAARGTVGIEMFMVRRAITFGEIPR